MFWFRTKTNEQYENAKRERERGSISLFVFRCFGFELKQTNNNGGIARCFGLELKQTNEMRTQRERKREREREVQYLCSFFVVSLLVVLV